MGRIKYIKDIRNLFKRNVIVDINSLKKFIQKKKKDERYVHQIIHNMIKNEEIKRIAKGFYSIYDDPILSVFCFKPSYVGLQSALSIHNLWEQETNPVIITAKKIRQGIRKVNKNNVILHRINPKYFFGMEYIKENNIFIPVSDIEKTFIDMVYFRQNIDKELVKIFKEKLNKKKLKFYSRKYPKNISPRIIEALK